MPQGYSALFKMYALFITLYTLYFIYVLYNVSGIIDKVYRLNASECNRITNI
jgi:hypothetical protein